MSSSIFYCEKENAEQHHVSYINALEGCLGNFPMFSNVLVHVSTVTLIYYCFLDLFWNYLTGT